MTFLLPRRALAMIAPVLTVLAVGGATAAASGHHHAAESEKLVVRGAGTVVDGGPCPGGVCKLTVSDGAFRGAPVGTGAYTSDIALHVAETFPNGEGGVCAPIEASITLGAGTPNRLLLSVEGDSCQDGAGDPRTTAFTGLGKFKVKQGTGAYAGARGRGVATFLEGADDQERMTLIGRIVR
jgi:hypothetical protein